MKQSQQFLLILSLLSHKARAVEKVMDYKSATSGRWLKARVSECGAVISAPFNHQSTCSGR